jgi:hypothetical protein
MPRKSTKITEELVEKEVKTPIPVKVVKRLPRKVSFEQWARARGVKRHHKGGLKAHVLNPRTPRSYKDWDKAFADY